MNLKTALYFAFGFLFCFFAFNNVALGQTKKRPPVKKSAPKKVIRKTQTPLRPIESSNSAADLAPTESAPTPTAPPAAENSATAFPDASLFEKSQLPSPFVRWSLFLNGGLTVPGQADANPRLGYGGGLGWPVGDSSTMALGFLMSKETRVSNSETFQFDTYSARLDYIYWFRSPMVEGLSMGVFAGWSQVRYRLANGLTQTLSLPVNRTNKPLLFGGKIGWDWGLGNTLSFGADILYGFYLPSTQLNAFQTVDLVATMRIRF